MILILIISVISVTILIYKNFGTLVFLSKFVKIRASSWIGREKVPEAYIINEKVMCIQYRYNGNLEKVFLPYNKAKIRNINKYVLIDSFNKESDITQQKGINYYVNAEMLGGNVILVRRVDDTIATYGKGEVPLI